jgi:2,3-bisphosphoglycerate-independent phosphoglycerate mutase
LERWFRLPKSHERRIHGRRHAGVRLVQTGATLVPALDAQGPWRLLLLPDHATPLRLRTHTPDPVPYLLVGEGIDGAGGTYTEAGVAGAPLVAGHELMTRLLGPSAR